jgi:cytoskeletal protein CcmA (bactofilin family)
MGLFGKDHVTIGKVETVLGPDVAFKGSIVSKNSIRIDGELHGSIMGESGVIIGEKAIIRGNIQAKQVIIGGKIKGNIVSSYRIDLQNTAQVEGDLSTHILNIVDGAIFEGNCHMEEHEKVVDLPKVVRE